MPQLEKDLNLSHLKKTGKMIKLNHIKQNERINISRRPIRFAKQETIDKIDETPVCC